MNTIRLKSLLLWIPTGLVLMWSAAMNDLFTNSAQAEWYVGGYGGIANPGAFSNVTASNFGVGNGFTNARLNDLELKSTLVGEQREAIFVNRAPG